MNLGNEILTDRDVVLTLAGWEAMRPHEPLAPEPVFVWPVAIEFPFTFILIFRFIRWRKQMKRTNWHFFHEQYQSWYIMIGRHYNELAGDKDRYQSPELMKLWDYQTHTQARLREHTLSQREWNLQKKT